MAKRDETTGQLEALILALTTALQHYAPGLTVEQVAERTFTNSTGQTLYVPPADEVSELESQNAGVPSDAGSEEGDPSGSPANEEAAPQQAAPHANVVSIAEMLGRGSSPSLDAPREVGIDDENATDAEVVSAYNKMLGTTEVAI